MQKLILAKFDLVSKMVIFVLLFMLLFTFVHRGIFDLDIWLHLKAGEWVLQNKAVPKSDIFSFTIFSKPWIDHSWLFQLIVYLIYRDFGSEGLVFLESVIVCTAFLFLALSFYRSVKYYYLLAIAFFFAIFACVVRYNIRPDIFSLLFFSVYLFYLKKPLSARSIGILVFVQILWVNFHGYFYLGPLLVLFFILEEFLAARLAGRLPWQWSAINRADKANYSRLVCLFLLAMAANLINPQFLSGALYPFGVIKETLIGENKLFFSDIQELRSVFKTQFAGKFHYFSLMIGALALSLLNYKKLRISNILLWAVFVPFSLVMRNITYLVLAAFYVIGSNLEVMNLRSLPFFFRKKRIFWLKILIRLLILASVVVPFHFLRDALFSGYFDFESYEFKSNLQGTLEYNYPKKAVDFVLKENLPARMMNDFNSGAYLIGRTYPKRLVFLDGRTELYGLKFHQGLRKVFNAEPEAFESTVKLYNITAIFLSYVRIPPNGVFLKFLYNHPKWKMVYFDDCAVIFLKDNEENKNLIKRFQVDFSKWEVPVFDVTKVIKFVFPEPYIKRAEVLSALGLDEPLLKEVNEALRIMPNCAAALNYKGELLFKKGLTKDAFALFRAAYTNWSSNLTIIGNLAEAYAKMGEYDKAIKYFEFVLKKDNKNLKAYKVLASVYAQKDDLHKAGELLNKAKAIYPNDKEINELLNRLEKPLHK